MEEMDRDEEFDSFFGSLSTSEKVTEPGEVSIDYVLSSKDWFFPTTTSWLNVDGGARSLTLEEKRQGKTELDVLLEGLSEDAQRETRRRCNYPTNASPGGSTTDPRKQNGRGRRRHRRDTRK